MKRIVFNTINILITLVYILVLCVLSYYVYKLNIIPNKYLIVAYGLIGVSSILLIFNLIRKCRLYVKIISVIMIILMTIGMTYITYYLNNTYHFLNKTQVSYDTLSYSVIVKKNSSYTKIEDLKNKNIAYVNNDDTSSIKKELSKMKFLIMNLVILLRC